MASEGQEIDMLTKKLQRIALKCNNSTERDDRNQIDTNEQEEDISVMITDYKGIIHAFSKKTAEIFQVGESALRGKNFFHLMSSYSRRYLYETYGSFLFKTFKETSRTIRYSLPHGDDVNYPNFRVVTSRILLVKPKVVSPLKTDPYMIKIITRLSSDKNRQRLYNMYVAARLELRKMSTEQNNKFAKDMLLRRPTNLDNDQEMFPHSAFTLHGEKNNKP